MKVCFAVSECVPYVKTGGLADVAGALPKALDELGCEVKLFLPLYGFIDPAAHGLTAADELQSIPVQIGGKAVIFKTWYGRLPDTRVDVHFIDCPEYFHRAAPYTDDPDEDERFILFQHAILQILQRYHWAPDVVHCNDWQTALLPVYLKKNYSWDHLFAGTASLLSIHNIGYQGSFPPESVSKAGLSVADFYPGGPYEFYGRFCFLKTGVLFADCLSTVSETYAEEIQTPQYGERLEGLLAARKADLFGILNGIDTTVWNPRVDTRIPYHYSERNLANKVRNKRALLAEASLPFDENTPVIGMISRLTPQKGFDLVQAAAEDLMKLPLQIVALGSGDGEMEEFLRWATHTYPKKFAAFIGYNEDLAHKITAGADMFLMPSRYEPCGLNQMYSLNYGTVPIVRRTGGLADTVKDVHEYYGEGNGFSFHDYSAHALYLTVRRALDLFKDRKAWREIMRRGMKADFSWSRSAKRYLEVYKLAQQRRAAG
ncbi:MAG: glycogen synthase GlgA [Calditrichaeota bacterium]|nr:MAG: glycogen synthase GlgA [Calditrichota bacterium]